MDKETLRERRLLVESLKLLNHSLDKLLVTLSGGALGLSMVFLRDVISTNLIKHNWILVIAWPAFILCLAFTLANIIFGIKAHEKAIEHTDKEMPTNEKFGGSYSRLSDFFYLFAIASVFVGILCMTVFMILNLRIL